MLSILEKACHGLTDLVVFAAAQVAKKKALFRALTYLNNVIKLFQSIKMLQNKLEC